MDHIINQAFDNLRMHNEVMALRANNERLKAKVDRLTEQDRSQTESHRINTAMWKDEVAELRAEVERLTKAGDAFYESEIGYYGEQILNDPKHHSGQMCRDWNAAKEGKQP